MWLYALIGVAACVLWKIKGDNSAKDSDKDLSSQYNVDSYYMSAEYDIKSLIDYTLNAPYYYGHPTYETVIGGHLERVQSEGTDCTGLVCTYLVAVGRVSKGWVNKYRRSVDMGNGCDLVPVGQQKAGDIALYNGHAVVVIEDANPDKGGHSAVLSASGGHSYTKGNDPNARVKIHDTALYRDDFICYMREKPGSSSL